MIGFLMQILSQLSLTLPTRGTWVSRHLQTLVCRMNNLYVSTSVRLSLAFCSQTA